MTVRPAARDGGTVIPLVVLGFLLAVLLLAASTAGGAALVARRRLAADCDAAALAGAAAAPAGRPTGSGGRRAEGVGSGERRAGDGSGGRLAGDGSGGRRAEGVGSGERSADGSLPLDPVAVRVAVRAAVPPGTGIDVATDGRTVTVRCRRTVTVPFGAVLGRPDGIDRTATSRARTRLRPPR